VNAKHNNPGLYQETLQTPFNPLIQAKSISLFITIPPGHLSYPSLDPIHFILAENKAVITELLA